MDVESIGTSEGKPTSRWPADQQARWLTACELLKAGQYARAAELLHELQAAAKHTGQAGLANILAAAHQICLACDRCQAEVEWHGRACQEAEQREQELQQQLHDILDLVIGRGALETEGKRPGLPTAPTTDLSFPEHNPPQREERAGLWQRIRLLLGREPSPRSPEEEEPVVFASVTEAPILPATEETKAGAPHAAGDAEAPVRPGVSAVAVPALPPSERIETSALAAETVQMPMLLSAEKEKMQQQGPPLLVVYCLGAFRVYLNDQLITDWNGLKGIAILKYLVVHKGKQIAKDILMDLFWRDADPEAARRNLHQAVYALRQAMRRRDPDFQHIQFENDCYLINPEMEFWIDYEEFEKHVQAGRRLEAAGQFAEAMAEYGIAEGLYHGDLLEEDLYEDWCRLQREHAQSTYLEIADRLSEYYVQQVEYTAAIALCQKILAQDNCYEEAHRRLMQCYVAQGQRHMAVRQYQTCVEALTEELDLRPSEETVALYRRITTAA